MIWFTEFTPQQLNDRPKNHLGGLLDIQFTEIGEDSVTATMPVDERTHQPAGILHGGASVVLAETLGSIASFMCIDPVLYQAVGLEINANHLRPVKSGKVTGICKSLHKGAKTHVWEIKIYDDRGKMNCVSRLTVAIIPKIK
ncbi:1,4-dihydroxy-2-naphthoyl-CoA hydrolase [Pedobacter cryoconitis]|uniref:1,4-dihydroxy-2-naphthoyl-CoA hydrolase n=1 Tax=Pedobacter cryoconitis TaxID=188932 RepID=A0A7W8ZJZ4_9SPHI|nr:hotdog fold thioesterase [Pedobacter cryoconitis]MBB5635446.1 1,4-dihydroxy-2-naphthoyl-CoA hydrolase [Pedobacter cryoconitis]MBB6273692.1 1,4-dihydroxy-2-naphthoyl-CoA hydrolase [Pedobacter cryoconitis]